MMRKVARSQILAIIRQCKLDASEFVMGISGMYTDGVQYVFLCISAENEVTTNLLHVSGFPRSDFTTSLANHVYTISGDLATCQQSTTMLFQCLTAR